MALGLADTDVVLVPHDAAWQEEFETEKKNLQTHVIHALAIEHCGSTSIPNIPAKPIMNICIGVVSLQNLEPLTKQMMSAGYIYKPDDFQDHELFVKTDGTISTHHVHVMTMGSVNWRKAIAFRDHLATHPEVATAYGTLKTELAAQYPHDRKAYAEGKNPFINETLKNIL